MIIMNSFSCMAFGQILDRKEGQSVSVTDAPYRLNIQSQTTSELFCNHTSHRSATDLLRC